MISKRRSARQAPPRAARQARARAANAARVSHFRSFASCRGRSIGANGRRCAQTGIEAQTFGDYKLYPLPEAENVAARQTKQVQFLCRPDVVFERVYRYSVYDSLPGRNQKAEVILRLHNRVEDGLGKPLSAGGVSVFETSPDRSPVFAGHDSVNDIATDLPFEITTGRAMAVPVETRVVDGTTTGSGHDRQQQEKIEVTVENRKAVAIVFALRQSGFTAMHLDSDERFENESGFAVCQIRLAPGESRTIRYTIQWPA